MIILTNGDMCVSHCDGGQHKACDPTPNDNMGIAMNGTHTTTLSCGEKMNVTRSQLMTRSHVQSHALVLPIYSPMGRQKHIDQNYDDTDSEKNSMDNENLHLHFMTTEDWEERLAQKRNKKMKLLAHCLE